MRYTNGTSTELHLVSGDIRDAREPFVVIGRDPTLREHYCRLTGKPFARLSAWWMQECPVQVSRASDGSLNVFATTFRPSESSQRRSRQIRRLQSAIENPLARFLGLCKATEVALAPISCRAPEVVASGMVRIIWDMSVAAFLHVPGPFKDTKPTRFTIYCQADLQPFIDVLDRGDYASLDNGWQFNTEVQCHRAKRARYLARREFKYRVAGDGYRSSEKKRTH